MQENPTTISAVEVVRCVLLARELRRLGHLEAAGRWEARAKGAGPWDQEPGTEQAVEDLRAESE